MKPIMMMRKMGLAAMALLLLGGNAPAQTGGVRQGAAQKDAAQQYGPLRPGVPQRVDMQWWQDSHYGLFLHMGLYTVAGGEWKGKGGFGEFIQLNNKIPVAEMREEAKRFNPVQFDANEWVAAARRAGSEAGRSAAGGEVVPSVPEGCFGQCSLSVEYGPAESVRDSVFRPEGSGGGGAGLGSRSDGNV